MNRRRLLLASLVGLFTLGCAGVEGLTPKPVPDDKLDYVGTWTGSGHTLTIGADGSFSHVTEPTGGTRTEFNAPIQLWHHKGFDVGIGPLVTTYEVSEAPHRDGGTWKMTVNGHALQR